VCSIQTSKNETHTKPCINTGHNQKYLKCTRQPILPRATSRQQTIFEPNPELGRFAHGTLLWNVDLTSVKRVRNEPPQKWAHPNIYFPLIIRSQYHTIVPGYQIQSQTGKQRIPAASASTGESEKHGFLSYSQPSFTCVKYPVVRYFQSGARLYPLCRKSEQDAHKLQEKRFPYKVMRPSTPRRFFNVYSSQVPH